MPRVTVVRTGVANTASVAAAFGRLGFEAVLSDDPSAIDKAPLVVLPGVGSFGAGIAALERNGTSAALSERIGERRPTLAVCLGMQMLFETSDESPGVRGLGVLPGHVGRFRGGVRVPQFGWNRVASNDGLVESGYAYFANSYRVTDAPGGWRVAWADHGGRFVAAIERGSVLACQFHPELSGTWGQALIRRWLVSCGVGEECSAC